LPPRTDERQKLHLASIMSPLSPTWQRFHAQPIGLCRFRYLFEKDVEPERRRAPYVALNKGRKMAVRFQTLRTELRNGGLLQYFGNDSGGVASDQIADLLTIGCGGLSETLAGAALKVFGTNQPPTATSARQRALQKFFGTHPGVQMLATNDELAAATAQLNGAEKEIAAALCVWSRLHSQYFTRLR
jgi:hypothetical protein